VYLVGREISQDRTVRIHGHIDKEDRDLIPGMYLRATIETDGQAVASLAEEAVVNYEDKSFIFVAEGDQNHFSLVEVGTGLRENGFIEIMLPSSLSDQTTAVVLKGAYKLLSKMKNSEEDDE
jgi:membrane fusion protein, heavy metal efflux system